MEEKMYYYIYRIDFLKGSVKGRYYIGQHQQESNKEDKYVGSSTWAKKEYWPIYGKIEGITYTKTILIYCDKSELNKYEELFLNKKYLSDPLCMNKCPGGRQPQNVWNKGLTKENCKSIAKLANSLKGKKGHTSWNKGLNISGRSGKPDKRRKRVIQFDYDGNVIKTWDYLRQIEDELGYIHNHISACCRGKAMTMYGYIWRFEDDPSINSIKDDYKKWYNESTKNRIKKSVESKRKKKELRN